MGILLLILAATLWGMVGPVSKVIFSQGIPPLETAFWRGSLAGFAFLIHWLWQRYPLPKSPRDWIGLVIFGIFGVGLLEGSFVLAVDQGGAALASILLYSAPIWVNLANLIIFKESIPVQRWLALAITSLGVVGICIWGATVTFSKTALFWGLMSGLSYAGFYIAGKIFFRRIHPVVVYMVAFPVASLAILPLVSLMTAKGIPNVILGLQAYSTVAVVACLFMGWVATYLPYLLYGKGLQLVDSGRAAIVTMLEPVVAVATASFVFGESFSLPGYLFAALVVVGVALS